MPMWLRWIFASGTFLLFIGWIVRYMRIAQGRDRRYEDIPISYPSDSY